MPLYNYLSAQGTAARSSVRSSLLVTSTYNHADILLMKFRCLLYWVYAATVASCGRQASLDYCYGPMIAYKDILYRNWAPLLRWELAKPGLFSLSFYAPLIPRVPPRKTVLFCLCNIKSIKCLLCILLLGSLKYMFGESSVEENSNLQVKHPTTKSHLDFEVRTEVSYSNCDGVKYGFRAQAAGWSSAVMQVVLWASEFNRAVEACIRSCPYNVTVIGLGQKWSGNGAKLSLALDYVR